MGDLALVVGLAWVVLFGFWIMGRLDRFFSRGGISPCWDAEEEQTPRQGGK
ncbi:hypothetical protein KQI82_00810 [Oscillibacter sp. MSJ-2]|uniref:Uncharacterized protein n=1 Tax=Dysosmobacter acutus TaxID=2841504 RepID=A0ABS6F5A7_9FIRM|nr:hypothetical protein [Dysosmobacter acutus]MBU5625474.1 hypothetical protein [Dysosmobacter acutus]